MKKIKAQIFLLMSIMAIAISLIFSSRVNTYAENDIEKMAMEHAREDARKHISTLLGVKYFVDNDCDQNVVFYIGTPFYIYSYSENELCQDPSFNFPIYQNGRVVLVLHEYLNEDGTWSSGSSYDMNDFLNLYPNFYEGKIVYNNGWQYVNDTETSSEKSAPSNVNNLTEIGYVSPPEIQLDSSHLGANGFLVNQPTYKFLNTNYCLVLQTDENGTQRGLCWAATAATIIRYLNGYHQF